jgi:hypothetical protein
MLLKNAKDANALLEAIKKCKGDVILKSVDEKETFNMKSEISRFVAMGRLCEERGDYYELFCMDRTDEPYLLQFFHEMLSE